LKERAVLADLGGLAYHHTAPMVYEQASAEDRAWMYLDPGQESGRFGDQARQERNARPIQDMREAMEGNSIQARVKHHFPWFGSRVPLENGQYRTEHVILPSFK
jgi:hypothetical protein